MIKYVLSYITYHMQARQRSRYSDCLRPERSGDRIPVGARFSALVQTGPEAHPASCTMGTGSFTGVRCGRGVTLTLTPFQCRGKKIEQSYTSTLPKGLRGLRKGETYLQITYMFRSLFLTIIRVLYKNNGKIQQLPKMHEIIPLQVAVNISSSSYWLILF